MYLKVAATFIDLSQNNAPVRNNPSESISVVRLATVTSGRFPQLRSRGRSRRADAEKRFPKRVYADGNRSLREG